MTVEGLLEHVKDSVTLSAMESAVVLTPCGHSQSEEIARTIFGTMSSAGACAKPNPCPLCRKNVTAYFPNHALRSVIELLLGRSPEERIVVPPASLALVRIWGPYPGKSGIFDLKREDLDVRWHGFRPPAHLLEFQSITADALFERVRCLQFRDQTTEINLKARPEDKEALTAYFHAANEPVKYCPILKEFTFTSPNKKRVLAWLASNNSFPPAQYEQLKLWFP